MPRCRPRGSSQRDRRRLLHDRYALLRKRGRDAIPYGVDECIAITKGSQTQVMFRQALFSRIVPCLKRVGLLSPRQRERFAELGILQYEDAMDPTAIE